MGCGGGTGGGISDQRTRPPSPHLECFSFPLLVGMHSPAAPGWGGKGALSPIFTQLQIETRSVLKGDIDQLSPAPPTVSPAPSLHPPPHHHHFPGNPSKV